MTKEYENMNENEKLHLLVSVANLYYEHNMTQSEIAERLFISRSKISRLLKEAREKKVVEIIIREPWDRLLDLEKDLKERYELKDIRIINTKGSPYETMLAKLGEIGAYYVDNLIEKNTILGISWGNTIYNLVHSLSSNKNIPITVVQIMGAAFKEKPEIDAMDLAKHVAKVYGGKYHYLYAPLFVEDKNKAKAILGALRGKYIDTLIMDDTAALKILELENN